jgi:hypothetical protein
MWLLSNKFFFPVFQIAILLLLVIVLWREFGPLSDDGAEVLRGAESMRFLERYTGLALAAIIAIVNKSVFDDEKSGFQHYSASINLFDLCAIVYMCYISQTGRNLLIGIFEKISH